MAERVKKLESQVQVLHVDLEELTGALTKLMNPEGSGQSVPSSQKTMQDYVF
jgi:GTP cyclohydrolase III